jgi:hypothetical protein
MIAKWVPAVRTPATPADVSRAYAAALSNYVGKHRPEAVAVLHAQGALETGRFAACWGHNAGNIKAGKQYAGQYCTIKLNEILVRNGKRVTVWFSPLGELTSKNGTVVAGTESADPPGHAQTRMRSYDTLADGITDKIRFLTGTRWRPSLERALAGDPSGYVETVRAAGYFTADLAPYSRAVVSLFKQYLPLARAQAVEPEPLPPEEEEQMCLDMAACFRTELPEWLRMRVAQITALTAQQMLDESAEARRKAVQDAVLRVGDGLTDDDD